MENEVKNIELQEENLAADTPETEFEAVEETEVTEEVTTEFEAEEEVAEEVEEVEADAEVTSDFEAAEESVEETEEPTTYTLEEYQALETRNAELEQEVADLNAKVAELTAFQASVEKERKQAMIDSFTMLEPTDKVEVQENIDKYSLDDIEAKLSIICVKKKVKFDSDEVVENHSDVETQLSYNLHDVNPSAEPEVPAWIKSVRQHKI